MYQETIVLEGNEIHPFRLSHPQVHSALSDPWAHLMEEVCK